MAKEKKERGGNLLLIGRAQMVARLGFPGKAQSWTKQSKPSEYFFFFFPSSSLFCLLCEVAIEEELNTTWVNLGPQLII